MILEYWIPSGKLTYLWKDPPVLMGKSTISMAIFNSYVKLPEGIYSILLFAYVVQVWLRSWVMQSLYANKPPKWAKHFHFVFSCTLLHSSRKKSNTSDHIRI